MSMPDLHLELHAAIASRKMRQAESGLLGCLANARDAYLGGWMDRAENGGPRIAVIYAAMRNPMIHESATYPISLHATKKGAWKAMRKFMFERAQEQRDFALQHGGKWMMRCKPLEFESYSISRYEVIT